jgi:hypothetical protein
MAALRTVHTKEEAETLSHTHTHTACMGSKETRMKGKTTEKESREQRTPHAPKRGLFLWTGYFHFMKSIESFPSLVLHCDAENTGHFTESQSVKSFP